MLKPIQLDENTLILDTETTGLGSDAEICEISIIDGLGNVVFDSLIKPINPIPDEVIKIHGITNEMVLDAPSFEDVYSEIILILSPFLSNKTVIIYNKMYDLQILKQVSIRCNKKHISHEPFEAIDAYTTCAMRYYSEFKNQAKWSKLTDACINMGIDITKFSAHRALGDCQMTLELIRCMNDPQYIKSVKNKEKIMLVEKLQTALTTIEFDIKFTPSVINFDEVGFKDRINEVIEPVKGLADNVTKDVLLDTLAKLRKFQKAISDRRISIVKDIKAPITDFEAKIKKGDAEIEQYISKYDASLKVILAKEKVAKHAEIEKLLPGIIKDNGLDKEHATKLTIIEDYYLAKWNMSSVVLSLVARATELFKQQDYIRIQEELKNTQIESRTRLIEQLNAEYNLNYTYATYPVGKYNDLDVRNLYLKAYNEYQDWEQESQKEEAKKQQPVIAPEGILIPRKEFEENLQKHIQPKNIETILEQSKQVIEDVLIENDIPSSRVFGIIPNGFTPTGECKIIYQNLRLGAATQAQIINAVADLKRAGVSVEFV
jgi:DNA polymerase-3 subunit epsilon